MVTRDTGYHESLVWLSHWIIIHAHHSLNILFTFSADIMAGMKMVTVEYLGHSAFMIRGEAHSVLIDPFITGNPKASCEAEDLCPDLILVTHAHSDHLGDAVEIAKATGATILATFELANHCEAEGTKVIAANIGGIIDLPFGRVKIYPAVHGSSTEEGNMGIACSFAIEIDSRRIYHAGDTALFGDLAFVAEDFDLDLALLPIGGHFTMGIDDAVKATRLLSSKAVIPMHYGTFEAIDVDPEEFRRKVDGAEVIILSPGERYEVP
jgi:L-ascorbate metabolism protein UlaG (beta-lactamase superfamily)